MDTCFKTSSPRGFTLVEVLVVLGMVGIMAGGAVPSYLAYIKKCRARAAAEDLATLAIKMEQIGQRRLQYQPFDEGTAASAGLFPGWEPSMGQYFSYTVASSATAYTLRAAGQGSSAGCNLVLDSIGRATSSSACGFSNW